MSADDLKVGAYAAVAVLEKMIAVFPPKVRDELVRHFVSEFPERVALLASVKLGEWK
jgi:hypothetical protein